MYNSGRRGRRASDGYGILSQADRFNQTEYPIPIVNSFAVTDGSYVPLDDTAVDTAGGQTIVLYGSGFAPGATVTVGGVTIGAVTYLDQGRLTFTSPANSSGSYTIVVINANGGAGILVPGLVYSGVPTWSTSAGSVGSSYERTNVSSTFVATGDAPMTYSILSGSLPPGTSLSTTGVLSGTAPVESGSTTYSFTIRATDGQLQDTDRSFSLTINTDVVTMSSPTNNQVISSYEYTPISNVTVAGTSAAGFGVVYSANAVPTGITLNANTGVISGTVNTVGNTFTRLTATANSTNRTATRDVVFNVNQDVVTWNSPANGTAYSLAGGVAISPVTLSATSAAGFGVQYSANALPSGLTLSGSTISGTPDTAQTVNTLLTATANTTNRSATRTISWSISLGDIYWKNVSLLLNANTPTPSFINDASLNNTQLTIVGDTRPNNFTPYEEGYYSNFFDGTGDYLNVTGPFSGTGAYTVEFWIYRTAAPGTTRILERGVTSTDFSIDMTTAGVMTVNTNAAVSGSTCTIAVSLNVWTHVALVRTSTGANDTRWYINGVAAGAFTHSTSFGSGGTLQIGRAAAGTLLLTGYLSNLRVVMGSAVYTSAFTPVTTPLTPVANTKLLTCQSNNFIDNSANNNTITKSGDVTVSSFVPFPAPTTVQYNTQYSTVFNGSSDNLSLTSQANLALGSGDFTVEMWLYTKLASLPVNATLYDQRNGTNGTGVTQPVVELTSASGYTWYVNAVNAITSGTAAVRLYQWQHLAISKVSGSTRMYVDGVQVGSTFSDSKNYPAGSIFIGRANDGASTRYYTGHISNLRVLVGTGLYSGTTITVPTSPLTAVANTQLLTCQDPTLIDKSTNAFTITSVSGPRPVAIGPFTSTTANTVVAPLGSTYFDGTGDYLTIPATPALALGSGDFTIEAWIYTPSTVAQFGAIICNVNNPDGFYLSFSTSNFITFSNYSTVAITSSSAVPLNTWTHVAVTRSGTSVRMFFNGVSVGTATNSTVYGVLSATNYIGFNGGAAYYTGYVSDLRVIKGTALYTSNFVPPQTALTPVANTQLLTCQTNGGHNNNQFVDQSSLNNLTTRTGNSTQGTFSPYSQTGWSNYFDGTGDYLTVPNNAALQMGSGDFTIEFWIYYNSIAGYQTPYSKGYTAAGDLLFQTGNGDGKIIVYLSGTAAITESVAASIGQWYHYALVRSGTAVTLYRNGVSVGTATSSVNFNTLDQAGIGATGKAPAGGSVGAFAVNGYMSNVRVVKGTAVYTSAFTPPTTPLSAIANTQLLTCQSNRLIDNSPNNFTITRNGDVSVQAISPFGGVTSVPTSYSNYFDGSGDYLSVTTNSALALPGDFTIEAWVYITSFAAERCLVDLRGATGTVGFIGSIAGTTGYPFIYKESAGFVLTSSIAVTLNQWTHVAYVRSGTTTTIYVNGVSGGSATDSTSWAAPNGTGRIGANKDAGTPVLGYISNFRIVKGAALYTGAFTPSTSPLTTTSQGATASQVSLLTCQSDRMVDNSINYLTLTAAGDVKPLPFNPFGLTNTSQVVYSPAVNGGSIYLDGSGDNVLLNTIAKYGSSNHTIECWVFFNNVSSRQAILNSAWSTGSFATDGGWTLDMAGTNAGSLNFALGTMSSGAFWIGAASGVGSFTVGQWYHIAVVRNGTTVTIYSNGVSIATGTLTASTTVMSNMGTLRIGAYDGGTFPFNGYISDVRVSSGALYTSNFTPPVAPLTPTVIIGANTFTAGALVNGTSGGIIDAHGSINLETVGDAKLAPEDAYSGNYYSAYFDGTGDYLTVPNSSNFAFGTGDFTIELWINTTDTGGGIIAQTSSGWAITIYGGLFYWQSAYNVTNLWNYSAAAVIDGKWHHVAFVRTSGTTKLYYDGTQVASNSDSTNYGVTGGVVEIGRDANPAELQGNLSNLRVVKGTAVYTSAFTPPTAPLSSVSGTSLLTFQSNKFVDNSSNNLAFTINGNVAVKSFNPFRQNTGKSLYFDGTGDYLVAPANPSFDLSVSDFTVELWVYFPVTNTFKGIWGVGVAGGKVGLGLQTSNNGTITFVYGNGSATAFTSGSTVVQLGTWNHLAVSRSGSTTRFYINGTLDSTTTASTFGSGSYSCYVGDGWGISGGNLTSGAPITGYIEDFRITKGVARYTTNFTPPTTTFEVK